MTVYVVTRKFSIRCGDEWETRQEVVGVYKSEETAAAVERMCVSDYDNTESSEKEIFEVME